MTTREIQGHLRELYGIDVSPELISAVTDAILDEVADWQNRPLETLYPLIFFRIKVRDEGTVRNKAVYVALGVRPDGTKEILGLWIEQSEGAKFWHERAEDPWRRGCADRHRRWPERLSRSHHGGVSASPGADLCRPSDPPFAGVRLVQGSQRPWRQP
jgi:transposase-like protein